MISASNRGRSRGLASPGDAGSPPSSAAKPGKRSKSESRRRTAQLKDEEVLAGEDRTGEAAHPSRKTDMEVDYDNSEDEKKQPEESESDSQDSDITGPEVSQRGARMQMETDRGVRRWGTVADPKDHLVWRREDLHNKIKGSITDDDKQFCERSTFNLTCAEKVRWLKIRSKNAQVLGYDGE